jgi:signal peptidase I
MNHKTIVHNGGIAAAVLAAAVIWFSCFDILQVQEISMEPEIHHGQTILVNKIAYRFPLLNKKGPSAEDVVVFKNPYDHQLVVKRCRLIPGDLINIDETGWLLVGKERYFLTDRQRELLSGIERIPEDTVLVLGDNSFHSVDSRDYGCVSIGTIRGKVINIFGGKNSH